MKYILLFLMLASCSSEPTKLCRSTVNGITYEKPCEDPHENYGPRERPPMVRER